MSKLLSDILSSIKDPSTAPQSLPSDLNISPNDLPYFLKQFNLFKTLSDACTISPYVNCFQQVNILYLEIKQTNMPHEESTFIKCVVTFIKEKMSDKKKYFLTFKNEQELKKNIDVLSQIPNAPEFRYSIDHKIKLNFDFTNYFSLFKYVKNYDNKYIFRTVYQQAIDNLIELECIYYLDIDKINIDNLIKYCEKYPNRIKKLFAFQQRDEAKLIKLCELNKESLIQIPNERVDLFPFCNNIEILSVSSHKLPSEFNNFNFEKIKKIETIMVEDYEDENEQNELINFLSKCPNLEVLEFSCNCCLNNEYFFSFFSKITNKKLYRVYVEVFDFEEEENYDPVFENLPGLGILRIEGHNSMDFHKDISPCFMEESYKLKNEQYEILINNYLNRKPYHLISLNFTDNYDEFMEYFKDKENIMSRILRISTSSSDDDKEHQNVVKNVKMCSIMDGKHMKKKLFETCDTVEVNFNGDIKEIKEFVDRVKAKIVIFIKMNGVEEIIKDCNEAVFGFEVGTGLVYVKDEGNVVKFETL